jgi:hypothetical protein
VTAAGLAGRAGFTLDAVEDLRLAIDEVCFVLIGPHGRPGKLHLTYTLHDDGLEVVGEGRFDDDVRRPPPSELSKLILAALVDDCSITLESDKPAFRFVKRMEAAEE